MNINISRSVFQSWLAQARATQVEKEKIADQFFLAKYFRVWAKVI